MSFGTAKSGPIVAGGGVANENSLWIHMMVMNSINSHGKMYNSLDGM